MALVVLLRGVNVGGHRTFRPSALVERLAHLDLVNIGAAGTFVVRGAVGRTRLRDELARALPFETEIVLCEGREILRLLRRDPFAGQPAGREFVRFVSVLARRPRAAPPLPTDFPPSGRWLLKVLEREERFLLGIHRREMKAIGLLGKLDQVFGVPVTTRNWNTIEQIATVLGEPQRGSR